MSSLFFFFELSTVFIQHLCSDQKSPRLLSFKIIPFLIEQPHGRANKCSPCNNATREEVSKQIENLREFDLNTWMFRINTIGASQH